MKQYDRYTLVSCNPAGYPEPGPARSMGPGADSSVGSDTGYEKTVGSGPGMVTYPDRKLMISRNFESFIFFKLLLI